MCLAGRSPCRPRALGQVTLISTTWDVTHPPIPTYNLPISEASPLGKNPASSEPGRWHLPADHHGSTFSVCLPEHALARLAGKPDISVPKNGEASSA